MTNPPGPGRLKDIRIRMHNTDVTLNLFFSPALNYGGFFTDVSEGRNPFFVLIIDGCAACTELCIPADTSSVKKFPLILRV
jgi:hypothetical protein